ncbi:MAG: ASKHA domain-containing protein, partial [Sedimentisphaerales bacterium]|nr:ASKHA domain-containing protein [Sedimentisphaerales bacterium]
LGQAPYHAYSVEAFDRTAAEMRIKINPAGNIHTIENIAGFVGSDTVAVAVAVAMDEVKKMTLVVDIGTNGEIILGTKDKMYAASCAAGPALEGARITQGSRAIDGAIERVVLNTHDIDLDVIGGKAPRTICGSGLIDAIALLVETGIIDSTGRFVDPADLDGKLPPKICARVIQQDNDQYAFVLAHNADGLEQPVILTQKDVRETQLAKAAIRAGIKLLQNKFGIADTDIEQILLAGAFGNYIRRKSAWQIGLLPNVPLERIHFVGNAASSGAQMTLTNKNCRTLAGRLARQIEYVEIAHDPGFTMAFADSIMFDLT